MPESRDWTVNEDGASNASDEFLRLQNEVARLIRSSGGQALSVVWSLQTARLILAQLTHRHGFGPLASADPGGEDREHGS